MMARRIKEFEDYLVDGGNSHIDLDDYLESPATAFLKYTVEAKSAIDLCTRRFPTLRNGEYSKAAIDSLEHLVKGMVPAIMGHFETFQRYMFARLFDFSPYWGGFDVGGFTKKLGKDFAVGIDLERLAAHRGIGANSIGVLLADSISGWSSPQRVNQLFDLFGFKKSFYSNDDCRRLQVLWQLRHSIVHTGGTITLPDAQKLKPLSQMGNRNIVFEKNFIFEVSRRMHPIVQQSVGRLESELRPRLLSNLPANTQKQIDKFFHVHSSVAVWLKT